MKISFIMPTYNDGSTIEDSINSLIEQSNQNWELVLVNDGSDDETENIITRKYSHYLGNKIKYIYQDNGDQLNAIIKGIEYISGEYVMIFHSDDLLPHKMFLENVLTYINKYPQASFFLGDLILINQYCKTIGHRKIKKYDLNEQLKVKLLLHLGRNLLCDVGIFTTGYFKNIVYNNYLMWNMPFWIYDEPGSIKSKNIEWYKLPEPILKYRISDSNYFNSDIGVLNVLNGELRTLASLLKTYDIPAFKAQFIAYHFMEKINLGKFYKVWYKKRSFKAQEKILNLAVHLRLKDKLQNNFYFKAIIEFYKRKSDRIICIAKIPEDINIYYGKDMRNFNKKLQLGTLEPFYCDFMSEMKKGFRIIKIRSEDENKLIAILKFFDIYDWVDIVKE